MGKLMALWNLFRKGNEVADPAKWKNGQITVTVLVPVLAGAVEAARSFGYDIPITPDQTVAIAGGIISVVNVVLTAITSKKVGLPDRRVADTQTDQHRRTGDIADNSPGA